MILVTPRLVHPMDCNQVPKRLPGRETRSPDDYELFLEGILRKAPRGQEEGVERALLITPQYKVRPDRSVPTPALGQRSATEPGQEWRWSRRPVRMLTNQAMISSARRPRLIAGRYRLNPMPTASVATTPWELASGNAAVPDGVLHARDTARARPPSALRRAMNLPRGPRRWLPQ